MPYNSQITRSKTQALIPEDVASEVITMAVNESAALTMFRRVPVAQSQKRIPILSALPSAYWVSGDTGQKQTSEAAWTNKYLNIEELAVIVPIPENVLDDTSYDVWGEVKPLLTEAIGRAFDAAVFFGSSAPSSFPTSIQTAAAAAGNSINEGATAANGGFHDDVDQTFGVLEGDGFDATGIVASRSAKGKFRRARATTGERLINGSDAPSNTGLSMESYGGVPVAYPMRGLFPSGGSTNTNVRLFVGDWSQFMVGVRKDITYKVLSEAVIQDNAGNIIYNLAQQDMVALRVTFRAGWQVANIINRDNPDDATRYPVCNLMF